MTRPCYLFALLALMFLSSDAFADGCGQAVVPGLQWHCCGTYFQATSSCGSGGDPHNNCYTGYGNCCNHPYTSGNLQINSSSCCQPPIGGCPDGDEWINCQCRVKGGSPIIIDTKAQGFHLTSADDGVVFDIAGNGHPTQMGWTAATSHNAFLALDRNGNGKIDDGKELFGNFTPQPKSDDPNGFLALEVFDKPENGGNGDGIIDHRDAVFSHLVLWIDENHDGISQPNELHSLPELGVFSLALKYRESRRTDQFGNQFRYVAAVNPDPNVGKSQDGRWTYDVFFVTIDTQAEASGRHRLCQPAVNVRRCGSGESLLDDRLDVRNSGVSCHKSACGQRSDAGGGQ